MLLQLGLVSERHMAEAAARMLGTEIVAQDRYPDRLPDGLAHLSPRFLRASRVLPLGEADGIVTLAMADPLDGFAAEAVAAALGRRVRILPALPLELEAALARLVPAESAGPAATPRPDTHEDDTERLKDMASEAPVIRLVNRLITRAVETDASDIHLEPFEDRLRVRTRHDGVLYDGESPPRHLTAAIISRIKIMARLDIAERRLPQDGRIRLAVRGQDVDLRVSTVAAMHGETVVLRVLDRGAVQLDWPSLGLSPAVIRALSASLELPNGILLITGPTGSGKTTTLYTGLRALNAEARKIVTIEDPIEYQLPGVNQVQVRPQIGLGFAALLRSILRQDPDVIMLGEIRDQETAQIAVQSALTGHLVLSTLHTNSAAATVTRLRDMGVEDYLVTAVLRGVVAQRLVRRLCTSCRRPVPAPPELVRQFDLDRDAPGRTVMLAEPVGCPHCRGTGFRGRQAIAEFLHPDDRIRRLIHARAGQAEVEQAAIAAGMVPMFQAGLQAALAQQTTVAEVVRSIRADGS